MVALIVVTWTYILRMPSLKVVFREMESGKSTNKAISDLIASRSEVVSHAPEEIRALLRDIQHKADRIEVSLDLEPAK